MYIKTLTANDFILSSDGIYVATILATTHELGNVFHVDKFQKRNDNYEFENVIESYKILSNGDIEIYSEEPGIYRMILVAD